MLKAGTEAGFWGMHAAVFLFSGLESFVFNFFFVQPTIVFPRHL